MMSQSSDGEVFSTYAGEDYDRLQPLRIEMYQFYHELALDFIPFDAQDEFRLLELGCGTGTFLNSVLERYPNARCVAFDYSDEMLHYAAHKVSEHLDRVEFHQRDLNDGLPAGIGSFHLVSSFSTVHHLTDDHKARLFKQMYDVLERDGWFFLIDAMWASFDDDVFRLGKRREGLRRQERLERAGVDLRDEERIRELTARVAEDSPEKDRIAPFSAHLKWLRNAGFRSVDHIWHFWMEHFIIARR